MVLRLEKYARKKNDPGEKIARPVVEKQIRDAVTTFKLALKAFDKKQTFDCMLVQTNRLLQLYIFTQNQLAYHYTSLNIKLSKPHERLINLENLKETDCYIVEFRDIVQTFIQILEGRM